MFYRPTNSKTIGDGNPEDFKTGGRVCTLCGSKEVSTLCYECKRVLCFGKDRSKKIIKLLKDNKEGPKLCRLFPALANLPRNEAPVHKVEIGVINGDCTFVGFSCFHLAHPSHFCQPCNTDNQDEDPSGSQLSAVASSAGVSVQSPMARLK